MLVNKKAVTMQALLGNGGNFLLFHFLWPAAVLGAVAGSSVWAWAVLFLQFIHGAKSSPLALDLRMALLGVGIGLAFETLLIASGLISYRLQPVSWLPPVWILLLWAGFAQAFNHSLAWLRGRTLLAAVAGGLASVVSMYAGMHFSAASSPAPGYLLCVYGLSWSVLVPLLGKVSLWLGQPLPQQDDGQYV